MRVEIEFEKINLLLDNGLSVKEISEEFGVNISTVKRRMKNFGLKSKFSFLKSEEISCLNCECKFKSTKSQSRKFCSQSCSAVFNNKRRLKEEGKEIKEKRIRKKIKIGNCLNCKVEIIRDSGKIIAKYCSVYCQSVFQMNLRIDSGKASLKTLKNYLIKNFGNKCMECGWDKVNPVSGRVPIELEHIDGNSENNNLENLKLLCPNCHSLTTTYKALNIGNGRHSRRERYKDGKSY